MSLMEMKLMEITLRGKRSGYAVVDASDFDYLSEFNWYMDVYGYVVGRRKGNSRSWDSLIRMHRLIMKAPDDMQVDHKNGNTLDNRRCNLRLCTPSQNRFNQKKTSLNTSKSQFKGVTFEKRTNKWNAKIKCNGVCVWIGCYTNEKDAARAYNVKANELFGDFARLNQIDGGEEDEG